MIGSDGSVSGKAVLLSTASSDGYINLYNLSSALSRSPINGDGLPQVSPVAAYDTKGSRLTCVFLTDGKKTQMTTAIGGVDEVSKSEAGTKTEGESNGMDLEDEDDEDDDDEDEEGEDMYDQGSEDESGDEDNLDGVEVEFEDEEEEEGEEEEEED